jgi:hypothetical protein
MLFTSKIIGDIPVFSPGFARRALTMLNVVRISLLSIPIAIDIGAHRSSDDRATDRSEIFTASAADLVTEDTANHGADDGTGNVGSTSLLGNVFMFNPTSLLGCRYDCSH